jgi:hypothetical protein
MMTPLFYFYFTPLFMKIPNYGQVENGCVNDSRDERECNQCQGHTPVAVKVNYNRLLG